MDFLILWICSRKLEVACLTLAFEEQTEAIVDEDDSEAADEWK